MPDNPTKTALSDALAELQRRLSEVHSHPQSIEIIVGHALIEREMAAVWRAHYLNSEILPDIGGENIWKQLKRLNPGGWAQRILETVKAYVNLRNAIAHARSAEEVAGAETILFRALAFLASDIDATNVRFGSAALVVTAALRVAFEEATAPNSRRMYVEEV